MLDRSWVALVVAVALGACASPLGEVAEGRVRQEVDHRQYRVEPRLDVFLVVNTGTTSEGASLRTNVTGGIQDRARALAEGEAPWLRQLSNPIDARAFVSNAEGLVRGPSGPALAWFEPDATRAGADTFAATIGEAIAAASIGEAQRSGVVAALHEAIGVAATPLDSGRLVVLVSTEDDASASATSDAIFRPEDSIIVILPSLSTDPEGSSAPNLEAWARANHAHVQSARSGVDLKPLSTDYRLPCLERHRTPAAPLPRCRVRALVPAGTACDPVRGWSAPGGSSGVGTCEVAALEGEARRACESDAEPVGSASGWCIPAPHPSCDVPSPRLVGGAAPPWATIETVCDLD